MWKGNNRRQCPKNLWSINIEHSRIVVRWWPLLFAHFITFRDFKAKRALRKCGVLTGLGIPDDEVWSCRFSRKKHQGSKESLTNSLFISFDNIIAYTCTCMLYLAHFSHITTTCTWLDYTGFKLSNLGKQGSYHVHSTTNLKGRFGAPCPGYLLNNSLKYSAHRLTSF